MQQQRKGQRFQVGGFDLFAAGGKKGGGGGVEEKKKHGRGGILGSRKRGRRRTSRYRIEFSRSVEAGRTNRD